MRFFSTVLIAIVSLSALASSPVRGAPARCATPSNQDELFPARVTRVIDGDTVDASVDGSRQRVRLIGIDTPEVHEGSKLNHDAWALGIPKEVLTELGRISSDFTRRQLLGRDVGLELDVQTHDRYGRLLAYVWLENGALFNMLIVRAGYAFVYTYPPNVKYAEVFVACQREARENQRGLWGKWSK